VEGKGGEAGGDYPTQLGCDRGKAKTSTDERSGFSESAGLEMGPFQSLIGITTASVSGSSDGWISTGLSPSRKAS